MPRFIRSGLDHIGDHELFYGFLWYLLTCSNMIFAFWVYQPYYPSGLPPVPLGLWFIPWPYVWHLGEGIFDLFYPLLGGWAAVPVIALAGVLSGIYLVGCVLVVRLGIQLATKAFDLIGEVATEVRWFLWMNSEEIAIGIVVFVGASIIGWVIVGLCWIGYQLVQATITHPSLLTPEIIWMTLIIRLYFWLKPLFKNPTPEVKDEGAPADQPLQEQAPLEQEQH